jgi:hypothetical protein
MPSEARSKARVGKGVEQHKTTQATKPSLMMNAIYQRLKCNNQNNLYHR